MAIMVLRTCQQVKGGLPAEVTSKMWTFHELHTFGHLRKSFKKNTPPQTIKPIRPMPKSFLLMQARQFIHINLPYTVWIHYSPSCIRRCIDLSITVPETAFRPIAVWWSFSERPYVLQGYNQLRVSSVIQRGTACKKKDVSEPSELSPEKRYELFRSGVHASAKPPVH
jgi:hypothetical protein